MLTQYLLHNVPTLLGWLSDAIVEVYIQLINYVSHVSLFHEFVYIVLFIVTLIVVAFELQYHLNQSIGAEADRKNKEEERDDTNGKDTGAVDAQKNDKKTVSRDKFYRWRWVYEIGYSIFAIGWFPVILPFIFLRWAYRKLKQILGRESVHTGNYLVASTGPSYLFALQTIVAIYILGVILDPLLASQAQLTVDASFWEYLLFGNNTAFGTMLPLLNQPSLALAVHFVGWTTAWWTFAQIIRLMNSESIFLNSVSNISDVIHTQHPKDAELIQFQGGFLERWRERSGHRDVWNLSYANRWHLWMLPVGGVFLLLGFLLLDADPYRLPSGLWVIGLLSWVSVLLNSTVKGKYSYTKPVPPVVPKNIQYSYGWGEVGGLLSQKCDSLTHRYHFVPPDVTVDTTALKDVPFLNPLFGDLKTADGSDWVLHPFQMELLTRFHHSLQKYTTVTVGTEAVDDLTLGQKFVYDSASDKRAWLSVWPDGFGKTESIFLHACHFYLSTSQRTIILTRSTQQAERLHKRFEQMLAGNTLRWSVPIAIADVEFYANVQDQYYPAILIASMEQVGLHLLTKISSRSDVPLTQYLSTVGMIQFEDLENYLGVIEQHVHFIFRRLLLQLYRSRHLPFGTSHWEPFVLGFSSDNMFNQRVWASSLVGIDFEMYHPKIDLQQSKTDVDLMLPLLRLKKQAHEEGLNVEYPVSTKEQQKDSLPEESSLVEDAVDELLGLFGTEPGKDAASTENGKPAEQPIPETPEQRKVRLYEAVLAKLEDTSKENLKNTPTDGHLIIKYNLNDFGGVSFYDIIDICEKLKVPWTYQLCGDGNREIGIKNLYLDNEPVSFTADIQSAAVILLTGHYVEIERDLKSKVLIGTRFCQYTQKGVNLPEQGLTPIAVIAQYNDFEYELFTKSPLENAQKTDVQRFPLPLVRKSGHWVLRTHFASDIVRFWLEVQDLVRVFGVDAGHIVQRLQNNNLLMLESHRVINETISGYSNFVVVRAKRTALPRSKADGKRSHLPLPLNSVEVASSRTVAIFDQSSSRTLEKVDINSAVLKYYLGKVLTTYFGHYVVKEYIFLDGVNEKGQKIETLKKIVVEPTLETNESTPRRAFTFKERPNPANEVEYRLYGNYGIGFALQSFSGSSETESRYARQTTQCIVSHEPVATLYLDAKSHGIKERRLLTRKESDQIRLLEQLHTDGLWIFPAYAPKEEIDSATMTLGAARICIAIWRMLLPNVYRGGDAVELGISIADSTVSLGQLDYTLTAEDALVFFDLQQEGSGVVHCIHREAMLTMLEFTYSFIQSCKDLDVFMRMFDHCPDESELFQGLSPLDWTTPREDLLKWLRQVLPIEDEGSAPTEPDPSPAPGPGPTDNPDAEPLLLDLHDSYQGAAMPWSDVVRNVIQEAPCEDVSTLLQVRLFSRDRTIERFIPVIPDVNVQSTDTGLEIDLPSSNMAAKDLMIKFFEGISAQQWESPVQMWAHVFQRAYDVKSWGWDTPEIGETGPYAVMDYTEVGSVLQSIVSNPQEVARSSIEKRLEALCTVFDWMHLNIRYETDDVLYNAKEYIARPTETLTARAGDCEDHANLIASFALGLGLVPRITLLEGHALCEIFIGKRTQIDTVHIKEVVQQYMASRCHDFGLEFGQWPFSQGNIAEGWLLNGMEITRKPSARSFQFYNFDMDAFQIIEENDECWLVLDDCFSGCFIGDAHKHMEKGYIYPGDKTWKEEKFHAYHYPTKQMIEEIRSTLFVTKDMDLENPPEPTHLVFRGGVLPEGLQRFEIMKHTSVDWVATQDMGHRSLSETLQTQIAEWVPPEERDVSPEEDQDGQETSKDVEPSEVDVDIETEQTVEGDIQTGLEEGVLVDESTAVNVIEETPTTIEESENSGGPDSSEEGTSAEEVPEPESEPECNVQIMDWTVLSNDVPTIGGEYGVVVDFIYKSEPHSIQWGFETEEALGILEAVQSVEAIRTPESMLSKEVYPDALKDLLVHLQFLYGGTLDTLFSEFVLAFVQALPTTIDSNLLSRTPSETILFGGSSADKSLLLHVLLQSVALDSKIAEFDNNRFACILSGPFGGYHIKDQDRPMYFADVGHLVTGIGYCKWLSIENCISTQRATWFTSPAKLFLTMHEESTSTLYLQVFVPVSEIPLWVVVTDMDTGKNDIFKLDVTHTGAEAQSGLIKLAVQYLPSDNWSIVLSDGECMLGSIVANPLSKEPKVESVW